MLAKLERRSISWWLFIMVTSVMGASLLTVFAYNVHATCVTTGGAGQTCTQGQQGCLSLGNDCFDTWTLFARAVNVIRPCSPSDACQATANTEHSVTVHNTCPTAQSIYIRYTVTINRANTQQEQCNVGTPNSQFVDGTHSVPANGGTFTNSYSQSFTDTLTNCLNCEYRVTALTEAGSAGADRTDELTFFGDCRNRPGC